MRVGYVKLLPAPVTGRTRLTYGIPGVDQVWTWGNATGSSWRMSNDIGFGDGKSSLQRNLTKNPRD